jgi:hypothetical protein
MLVGIGFISLITATVAHTLLTRAGEAAEATRDQAEAARDRVEAARDRVEAAALERVEQRLAELERLLREERGR